MIGTTKDSGTQRETGMIGIIRKRLTFANVMMTLALVFAMSGGAYAAKHYLITSTKQISPKVLKALQGNTGPAGPAGPEGKAGANGTNGAPGAKGEKGEPGEKGERGDKGETGVEGKEGSPWTTGGKLPSGKTLRGNWSVGGYATGESVTEHIVYSSASFGLTVENENQEPPTAVYNKVGETKEHCTGNAAEPGAEPGYLCVFAQLETGLDPKFMVGIFVVDKFGFDTAAIIEKEKEGHGTSGRANGTWAVTAS